MHAKNKLNRYLLVTIILYNSQNKNEKINKENTI